MDGTLLLIGGGKMGGAMLEGWTARGLRPDQAFVVEPDAPRGKALAEQTGARTATDAAGLPDDLSPEVVVVAVKPQMMGDVVPNYRRFVRPGCVFLSIAAGTTIGYFESVLGAEAHIVRAMPNTPASVGRGMTVGCSNGHVDAAQRKACDELLQAIGKTAWVEDEALMDAVTGVSGSGPAYIFLLAESLAKAGEAAGLPADLAKTLARQTVAGAGELLYQSPEDAAVLRQNVTSPGGTTAEALKVLMGPWGWQGTIDRAVAAATNRSKALSS
jgi:pyrroline-5-carboxylate reductase